MKANRINTRLPLNFRQWSRKGYGLFSVLGKLVKISFLMVVYLLVAEPAQAQKELKQTRTGEETDVTLEEIEVKGQRISSSLADAARIVRVITQKEIAGSPYSSVVDFLDQELSIDIRQRGQEGIQSDISMQGSTFEQVLVLINGIPINNPQTGHFNGDIPVPMQSVARIEIIQGGASRWLGPNAFAGAINIITRNLNDSTLDLKLSGGQYNYLDGALTAQFGKKSKNLFSIGRIQSSGYVPNTDLKSTKWFYHGSTNFKRIAIDGQAGAGFKKFGAQAFYSPSYPDQYEEIDQGFMSLGWKLPGRVSFKQDLYLRAHADEFHLFRGDSPAWYTGPNQHLSGTLGVINTAWWKNRFGTISVGADYKIESILSTVLGLPLEESIQVPFFDNDYLYKARRQNFSFYGEQVMRFNNLLIVGGLMSNIMIDDSLKFSVFPGIDMKYAFSPTSQIRFSANKSMRLPSFTELYYSSATNQGNPNLKAEESWSGQIGYQWQTSNITVNTGSFIVYGTNLIDWSKSPSDNKWLTRNINELFRSGIELKLAWFPFRNERWEKTKINAGYSYTYLSKSSGNYDSRYLLDHLKHKLVVSGEIPVGKSFHIRLQTIIQDRAGWYTDWNEAGEPFFQEFDPFILTNLGVSYSLKSLTIFANVLNLLDAEYADIAHVNQPGRWLRFGINLSI